jgi:hypothetical protein
MPRDLYDPHDPHAGRPTVVVAIREKAGEADIVTRTTDVPQRHDVSHPADSNHPSCDELGFWQPRRRYSVPLSTWDDPDVTREGLLTEDVFNQILRVIRDTA